MKRNITQPQKQLYMNFYIINKHYYVVCTSFLYKIWQAFYISLYIVTTMKSRYEVSKNDFLFHMKFMYYWNKIFKKYNTFFYI